MAIQLGSTNFGSLYLGSTKVAEAYLGSVKVYPSGPNYNPLNLPAKTMRVVYIDNYTPSFRTGVTGVQVSSSPNVWDITYPYTIWNNGVLRLNNEYGGYGGKDKVLQVLGANTQGVTSMESLFEQCTNLTTVALFDTTAVTNMQQMFSACTALTSVPEFDTSAVTNMVNMFTDCQSLASCPTYNTHLVTRFDQMFYNCSALTAVPLFDVTSATNVSYMFYFCRAVESGSLALYNVLSAKTWENQNAYYNCFDSCGSNTTSGAAELAQIPSSWK